MVLESGEVVSEFVWGGRAYHIERISPGRLPGVLALEQEIEGDNAASFETLLKRANAFPEGFLVLISDDTVVGYVESIIRDSPAFSRFVEISQFEKLHNPGGPELYVIFLAVQETHRSEKLWLILIKTLIESTNSFPYTSVSLIPKSYLLDYYGRLGFGNPILMPDFLTGKSYQWYKLSQRIEK